MSVPWRRTMRRHGAGHWVFWGRRPTYPSGVHTGTPSNGACRAAASTAISGSRWMGHFV